MASHRKSSVALKAAIAATGVVMLLPWWAGSPAVAADHAVDIKGLSFFPETLTIAPGDTVTWTNFDTDHHDLAGGPMDSPELSQNDTYAFTFTEPEQVEYACKIHTYMRASVTVTNPDGTPPPTSPPDAAPPPASTTTTTAGLLPGRPRPAGAPSS